jgi:hypothetical protein
MNTTIQIDREALGKFTFAPQPDITALEAAQWAQLLFCVPTAPPGYDAWKAVEQFGLERHFAKVDEPLTFAVLPPAPENMPALDAAEGLHADPQGFVQPTADLMQPPPIEGEAS